MSYDYMVAELVDAQVVVGQLVAEVEDGNRALVGHLEAQDAAWVTHQERPRARGRLRSAAPLAARPRFRGWLMQWPKANAQPIDALDALETGR